MNNDDKINNATIRYLNDEKFIEWILCPTDALANYWQEYLEDQPEEEKNLLKAKEVLKGGKISVYKLDESTKEKAIQKLKDSIDICIRKRKIRKLYITLAGSAVAILLFLLLYQNLLNGSDCDEKEFYVGSILNSEDIQLFTGNLTTTFEDNIDITIGDNQLIQVKKENSNDMNEFSVSQNSLNRLIVPYGKRSKILLPDGSRIWLNAGSTLIFPSTFGSQSREIKMEGEIFAEVAHDPKRPFIVTGGELSVKVYGTSFNLSTYEDTAPWVVLVEGNIGLKLGKGKEMMLEPSEYAFYDKNGNLNKSLVNVNNFVSWKNGYLTYQDTPIVDVLRQIERYYNLSFNLVDDHAPLQEITCCGKIILSDNLDNVLTALTLISNTRYHRENKSIYIYQK